ncbi:4-hydroxy-tetrahydrodipicolinate reductase [Fulvivirga lutimaris]|uniref:4-hydroxy-tetrahydrodipicolinate reductase n=1 Tax=Fulvivirga lutimaris TaxID=1819566 RepID=UPI00162AA76E|nr:4-hydroxy-tetrahydrodipicolinate reductase [Fulvivirga lutimaris]
MRILLIGYGKMGHAIEAIALKRDHQIAGTIDRDNADDLQKFNSSNTDVAIEFSQPESAFENIKYCLENNIPILSGTTGWLNKKNEVEELCKNNNGTFFYASNYSIGVNLFFQLNEQLAQLMADQAEYNVDIDEIHHTQKKDAPSGTAISLAEGIIDNNPKKENWLLEKEGEDAITIHAHRVDNVPGTHTVKYSSPIDDIEIKHTAHSREGFAMGAVMVSEWLPQQKGLLSMKDFLANLKK